MPTQAKKVTATPTLDKQTKTKKKKKSNSSHKTNRKDSGSESNEGRRNKSKSRRGRSSSDSNGPSHGSSSNGIATTLSSSSSHSNDRSTSSSSGENITVSYQSETCDLDACRGTNELNEESQTSTDITPTNESLRWNLIHQENQDQEEDRMRLYKINRRKRYMDVLQRNPDDRANQFYA